MNRVVRGGGPGDLDDGVRKAREAVSVVFVANGFLFASLVSRLPDVRSGLGLDNGELGLVLLAVAVGSLIALPLTGRFIDRWGATTVVRVGVLLALVGVLVAVAGVGGSGSVPVAVTGLFGYGMGIGAWDVAMNVEGAEVERRLGRSIMPRFHAAFSLGTILGAGFGVVATAAQVPMAVHLGALGVLALVLTLRWAGGFLAPRRGTAAPGTRGSSAWLEPVTLAIGVMVLSFAVVEGSANDWLTLALIDGYEVPHWVGVGGYALFLVAMTSGRVVGTVVLDRWGRPRTLWVSAVAGAIGISLVVLGQHPALVVPGILLWGLGASLGFPVGMSAASDDPARAAARVSVVSTIGYAAFLAGPPLLGQLANRVGTLESLLAVAVIMVPAAISVAVTARPARPARPA